MSGGAGRSRRLRLFRSRCGKAHASAGQTNILSLRRLHLPLAAGRGRLHSAFPS